MPSSPLSEALIRQNTAPRVLERARNLVSDGSILQLHERGEQIHARVQGSEFTPYEVVFTFGSGNRVDASCTCPYEDGGWCKHCAAVALSYLHNPQEIEKRPSVEELLQPLDSTQLRQLIQALIQGESYLLRQVERLLVTIVPTAAPLRGKINPSPYRQQMRELLDETLQAWEYADESDPLQDGLPELLEPVKALLAKGDPENAMVILQAITEVWVEGAKALYDWGGDPEHVLYLLEFLWSKAILLRNPDSERRIALQIQLEEWGSLLGKAVLGEDLIPFEMTAAVLRQGWDHLALVAVLAGESEDLSELWEEEEPPEFDSDLIQIRLQILAQQNRQQEYLRLAEATDRWEHALVMRAKMGQIEQVMGSLDRLSFWTEAFAVAQALKEQGSLVQALEVARYGLKLPAGHWDWDTSSQEPDRYPLAIWAVEVALELGEAEVALDCQKVAFKARPSLDAYHQTEVLAGSGWGSLKPELLQFLKSNHHWRYADDQIRIFLAESEIELAMSAVKLSTAPDLVRQVMQAALARQPEWVLQESRRRAEPIMTGKASSRYDEAVDWLTYTRAAYRMLNQEAEWHAYRAQVQSAYGRQYKLMGLLKQKNL
ncbi:MAG: SWIM zinc finger family protein [Cyanobacteriota bacterium]